MGLDVAFDRQCALARGLEIVVEPRGSEEDLRWARTNGDEEAYKFYSESVRYIRVPGTEFYAEDSGVDEHTVVRANKWGRVYYPLTDWLRKNDIPWSEW